MEKLLEIKFDGACDNNSKLKYMGIGVVVYVDGKRDPDLDFKLFAGSGTSMIAEWIALVEALKMAFAYVNSIHQDVRIRIYGDSQTVIRQYTGRYEMNKPHLWDYEKQAKQLAKSLGSRLKRVDWIPRKENGDADVLSKEAILDYLRENNLI